jgi:hypothetical protein
MRNKAKRQAYFKEYYKNNREKIKAANNARYIELKEEKGDMTLYYLDLLNIYDDACIKSLYLKKENINTYYYSDILFQKANCYYDSLINNLEKSEMFYTASAFRKNKQDFIQQYKILNKNL